MTGQKTQHGNTKHGYARRGLKTREYKTWESMKRRCFQPSQDSYRLYGGRGITVCSEWLEFEGFYRDMGDQPDGMTLERTDPNENYCKANCTWASNSKQQQNKRTTQWLEFNGERLALSEWARRIGISQRTLWARVSIYGWSVEKALTNKVMTRAEITALGTKARRAENSGTTS